MRQTKYICDLCGKEITTGTTFALTSTTFENFNVQYDICEDCYHDLAKWLEAKMRAWTDRQEDKK